MVQTAEFPKREVRVADTPDDVAMFQGLLNTYNALPKEKVERTLMQISGYPHYENVCSNILAFFLNPENEHGLGDWLLQALFQALSVATGGHFDSAEVEREVPMMNGGRLDLMLTTRGHVVGIENKIYHELDNDLDAYARTIQTKADRENRVPLCVVLGLSDLEQHITSESGFVSLTYSQWFRAIRSLRSSYDDRAHPKYLTFLEDFIRTIEELQGGTVTHAATEEFFEQHADDLERLTEQYKQYKQGLAAKHIPPLEALMAEMKRPPNVTQWVWSKYDLVHDFEFQGTKFALDTMVLPGGWLVLFWPRSKRSQIEVYERLLTAVCRDDGPPDRTSNGRAIIARFALTTPHEVIADTLLEKCRLILDGLAQSSAP